ncbi:hypothetical protein AVEN_165239-1 [Araneus ventricosus]|uniref:Uncharacterized protein n=1 Tax=Araneus ventricosus TaxID=182803 RepID=A0A4Y2B5J3_ARAVE|nr:hypothetical protein AVEN_165239-1 [Araneus ventricosus]
MGPQWPNGKVSTGELQARNPIPQKICRVWGLLHVKSVVTKRPPTGVVGSLERGCQLRCRSRHLTAVQNDEVRPKIALVLLQNAALI